MKILILIIIVLTLSGCSNYIESGQHKDSMAIVVENYKQLYEVEKENVVILREKEAELKTQLLDLTGKLDELTERLEWLEKEIYGEE